MAYNPIHCETINGVCGLEGVINLLYIDLQSPLINLSMLARRKD